MGLADYPLLAGVLVIAMGLVKIIERLLDARGPKSGKSACSDPPPACLGAIERVAEAQEQSNARQAELREMFRESIKEQREFRVALERWIGRWEARMEADTGSFRSVRG